MARRLARRRHWERLAGALIAVLGVAVLVVAIIALRNPKQPSTRAGTDTRVVTSTVSAPTGSTSTSPSKGSSKRAAIGSQPLIVLNDTGTANLASNAAARFERGGWTVTNYDENYSNDIVSTCAYYDPAVKGSKAAAQALRRQYPTIKRIAARFPQLPSGPVVVVLTADYVPS